MLDPTGKRKPTPRLPAQVVREAFASPLQRGRLAPSKEALAARHAAAYLRHDSRNKLLAVQTDASFDCVSKGWTSPVDDQGSCGSCWIVAPKCTVESAYIKAGYGKDFRFASRPGEASLRAIRGDVV